MDGSSISTIGYGTLTISALSALITGSVASLRGHKQPGAIAIASTINSAVTAATFFSIRELAISPLLVYVSPLKQHTSRRQALPSTTENASQTTPSVSEEMSWSALRTHNLLDSGLSGAVTGGLLRGLKSGPRSIPSGSILTGLFCTLLQYGYNELATSRLRYISKLREEKDETSASTSSKTASQRLLGLFGVVSLSDEEYVVKMKKKRDVYLRRIAELEQEQREKEDVK